MSHQNKLRYRKKSSKMFENSFLKNPVNGGINKPFSSLNMISISFTRKSLNIYLDLKLTPTLSEGNRESNRFFESVQHQPQVFGLNF